MSEPWPFDDIMKKESVEPKYTTLRDQFAMAAMEGQIAHKGMSDTLDKFEFLAMDAYQMADAMLKARNE